ncbi:hypothetical protein DRN63_04125 [Nanoarchaeota archaeon]|nr:MAG: hypothetical protein DRN63_04125 [Nanoarchaeota archaeon]
MAGDRYFDHLRGELDIFYLDSTEAKGLRRLHRLLGGNLVASNEDFFRLREEFIAVGHPQDRHTSVYRYYRPPLDGLTRIFIFSIETFGSALKLITMPPYGEKTATAMDVAAMTNPIVDRAGLILATLFWRVLSQLFYSSYQADLLGGFLHVLHNDNDTSHNHYINSTMISREHSPTK